LHRTFGQAVLFEEGIVARRDHVHDRVADRDNVELG
jgi:hypothetical protein